MKKGVRPMVYASGSRRKPFAICCLGLIACAAAFVVGWGAIGQRPYGNSTPHQPELSFRSATALVAGSWPWNRIELFLLKWRLHRMSRRLKERMLRESPASGIRDTEPSTESENRSRKRAPLIDPG